MAGFEAGAGFESLGGGVLTLVIAGYALPAKPIIAMSKTSRLSRLPFKGVLSSKNFFIIGAQFARRLASRSRWVKKAAPGRSLVQTQFVGQVHAGGRRVGKRNDINGGIVR